MNAKITKIGCYLPEKVLTNQQLEKEFSDFSAQKIEKKVGIAERRIASDNETALDLAYYASLKALENFNKNKIDMLVLCTQSPEYYLPATSCILQDKLGLEQNIASFDINQGCSGYIYGLAIAKAFIKSKMARCILLVTSDTYSKYIHHSDKANRSIFGDGATATIIENSESDGLLEFELGTDGSGFSNLIVPNGGSKHKFQYMPEEIMDKSGSIRTSNNLYMNGPEIFNFTIKAVPKLVDEVLKVNDFTIDSIDYFIFHQANTYMLEYLRKKIMIPKEKFYIDMLHTGNTVSSTIPIALKNCYDKNLIKEGDKVMLVGFGVGYSWGGAIISL